MTRATGQLARRSVRLRFRAERAGIALVDVEHVEMISPPAPGVPPLVGENGGFWLELRDERDQTLAHRVVSDHAGGSVEVFSPDGGIRREFGPSLGEVPEAAVFEVLLPDEPGATQVVLIGEPLVTEASGPTDQAGARELARFPLPS